MLTEKVRKMFIDRHNTSKKARNACNAFGAVGDLLLLNCVTTFFKTWSIAVVPNRGSMDPQGSTERFWGVHGLYMHKMAAKCPTTRRDDLACKRQIELNCRIQVTRHKNAKSMGVGKIFSRGEH